MYWQLITPTFFCYLTDTEHRLSHFLLIFLQLRSGQSDWISAPSGLFSMHLNEAYFQNQKSSTKSDLHIPELWECKKNKNTFVKAFEMYWKQANRGRNSVTWWLLTPGRRNCRKIWGKHYPVKWKQMKKNRVQGLENRTSHLTMSHCTFWASRTTHLQSFAKWEQFEGSLYQKSSSLLDECHFVPLNTWQNWVKQYFLQLSKPIAWIKPIGDHDLNWAHNKGQGCTSNLIQGGFEILEWNVVKPLIYSLCPLSSGGQGLTHVSYAKKMGFLVRSFFFF